MNLRYVVPVCALLFFAPAAAFAFPAESAWKPIQLRGAPLTDPYGDAGNSRDIVGATGLPAGYSYFDATGLYLRMRLDKDPAAGQGFSPFGWGVALEYDGDLTGYDAMVWLDGVDNPDSLSLYANTTTGTNGVCDTSETLVDTAAAAGRTRSTATTSQFGNDADAFLDIFVPAAVLQLLPPKTGFTALTPSTVVQFVLGTSNSGNPSLSADVAGIETDGCDLASYTNILSDPPPGSTVLDTDGDGMPDYWERQNPCLDAAVNDAAGDADGDGISNIDEYVAGSNPCDPDSDDDGAEDGADNCPAISNPDQADLDGDGLGDLCDSDRDGDGIPNGDETVAGTDPDNADTDGDGLTDQEELDQGSNPVEFDSDGDGVADGKDNCALVSNPDQSDYDGDGQGDACEEGDVPRLGGGAMGCRATGADAGAFVWIAALMFLFGLRKRRA